MQQDKGGNEDRKDGEDSWKKKGIDDAAAADALDEDEATEDKITIPTKTEDGGSSNQEQEGSNISENENEEGQGQGEGTTSTSSRPDAFAIYSDDNTRMLTLLGLDPNEGEQVDWRQLTGFRGFRRRNNEDEGGNETTPRRTRLSYELHPDVFHDMLFGDLDLNGNDNGNADRGHGQARRHHQQGQDEENQAE